MKPWQFTLLIFLTISMVIISGSIYKAVLQKNEPSQNSTSGLLPYYSISVGLNSQENTSKIDLTFLDSVDLNFDNTNKNSKYDILFSSDSKTLILKKYEIDSGYIRKNSQIVFFDLITRKIISQYNSDNQDLNFDKDNNLLFSNKEFYEGSDLVHKINYTKDDSLLWSFEPQNTTGGSVWQIVDFPLYLPDKNWVVVHLFDPIDRLGKHKIEIFDLNKQQKIYSFDSKPFTELKTDKFEHFIYTLSKDRFDTDFFDLGSGSTFNINNKDYILASAVVGSSERPNFITNSDQQNNSNSQSKFLPLGDVISSVKIWDLNQKQTVDRIEIGTDVFSSLLTTNDSKFLLVATTNEKIHLIDLNSKKETLTLTPKEEIDQNADLPKFNINLSPNQKILTTIGQDGKLKIFEIKY